MVSGDARGAGHLQHGLAVVGVQVPQPDRVVLHCFGLFVGRCVCEKARLQPQTKHTQNSRTNLRGGEDEVAARRDGDAGDLGGVADQVADEAVRVQVYVAQRVVVALVARVHDGRRRVREARAAAAVLLRVDDGGERARRGVDDAQRVVVAAGDEQVVGAVEVERVDAAAKLLVQHARGLQRAQNVVVEQHSLRHDFFCAPAHCPPAPKQQARLRRAVGFRSLV